MPWYHNGGACWRNGRQLSSITANNKTYEYEYDVNGLRTRKTNSDGGYTDYFIIDGLTVAEQRFNADGTERYTLRYLYDQNNAPVGFGLQYPTSPDSYWDNYYLAKNLQGDVIGVYYGTTCVATYTYDPYGNPTGAYDKNGVAIDPAAAHVGNYNPFRYRVYFYDADTGFYYLQSRYYDPQVGRFLNADAFASTGQGFIGFNMFAYCLNAPVIAADNSGARAVPVQTIDGGIEKPKYNREAAVEYARKWYNSFNSDYYHYTTDCANFVSQCLAAGGLSQTVEWHVEKTSKSWWYNPMAWFSTNYRYDWDVGPAWRLAADQYNYFTGIPGNTSFAVASPSDIPNAVRTSGVQAGDLLYLKNAQGIHHAMFITRVDDSEIYYAAHTAARFDQPLSSKMGSECAYIVILAY